MPAEKSQLENLYPQFVEVVPVLSHRLVTTLLFVWTSFFVWTLSGDTLIGEYFYMAVLMLTFSTENIPESL